jgi:chemotaxis protein methyltransferase CheR
MALNDTDIQEKDVRRFQDTIRDCSSYDFGEYSVSSLKRRLFKVLEQYGTDMNTLTGIIRKDPQTLEEVVKKLMVSTTELFRDPPVWKVVMEELLTMFREQPAIRIWHPGCSTGQEVYSMMILLDQVGLLDRAELFASDINTDVMETAKKGVYRLRFNREYLENFSRVFSEPPVADPDSKFAPYDKYFRIDELSDSIVMHNFLRKKPKYSKIDLVQDENLFKQEFDMIICRNVIIYFNFELQNKVLHLFHRSMGKNGLLVLGKHESIIGPGSNLFKKKGQLYVKISANNNRVSMV